MGLFVCMDWNPVNSKKYNSKIGCLEIFESFHLYIVFNYIISSFRHFTTINLPWPLL